MSLVRTGIWTRNFPNKSPVWLNSIGSMLCAFKNFDRPHLTVGGSWNKSVNPQPLQRCYFENLGSPDSECDIRRHCYRIHAMNGLLAVGKVWKLTSWTPLVNTFYFSINFNIRPILYLYCIKVFYDYVIYLLFLSLRNQGYISHWSI